MKKTMNDNLMEIIVDKDGFCHLYVNGIKRNIIYIKFEMNAEDMLPKLETREYIIQREDKIDDTNN